MSTELMEALQRPLSDPGLSKRFWSKVGRKGAEECWLWIGSLDAHGYGRININRYPELAHRVAWAQANGEPGVLCVLHKCDNPPCVNPGHLFLGTKADNTADMMAKGRQVSRQSEKTHCVAGHPYSPENTYRVRGERRCRICLREAKKRYNQRCKERKASNATVQAS